MPVHDLMLMMLTGQMFSVHDTPVNLLKVRTLKEPLMYLVNALGCVVITC